MTAGPTSAGDHLAAIRILLCPSQRHARKRLRCPAVRPGARQALRAAMSAICALGRLGRWGCTAAGATAIASAVGTVGPAAAAVALSWRRPYSTDTAESWDAMRAGFSSIQAEVEGGVAVLTVARPEALNALNKQVRPLMHCPADAILLIVACMVLVATICGSLCSWKALCQLAVCISLRCLPQAMQKLVPRSQQLCRCNNTSPSPRLVAMPACRSCRSWCRPACSWTATTPPPRSSSSPAQAGKLTSACFPWFVRCECTGTGRQPGLVPRRCVLLYLELRWRQFLTAAAMRVHVCFMAAAPAGATCCPTDRAWLVPALLTPLLPH